jgi:hypothetical protein
MSEFGALHFAAAKFAFLNEAAKRAFVKEDWFFFGIIIAHSWDAGFRDRDGNWIAQPRAKAYFREQFAAFRSAQPDKSKVSNRLRWLVKVRVLKIEGPKGPKCCRKFFFNLDFDDWLVPRLMDTGERKSLKFNAPLDDQAVMQYGELPEKEEFHQQYFLAKYVQEVLKILRADAVSQTAAGILPGVVDASGQASKTAFVRAGAPKNEAIGIPPSPGAQFNLPSPAPPGPRLAWADMLKFEEGPARDKFVAALLDQIRMDERRAGANAPKILPPTLPAQQQTEIPMKINPARAPLEKEAVAWMWLKSVDTDGVLNELREGCQWRLICRQHPIYVLGYLRKRHAKWLRLFLEKKEKPARALAFLAYIALRDKKMFSLYSHEIEEELRAGDAEKAVDNFVNSSAEAAD